MQALSVSDGIPCRSPVLSLRTPVGNTLPRDRSGNAQGSCVSRIRPSGDKAANASRSVQWAGMAIHDGTVAFGAHALAARISSSVSRGSRR